MNRKQVEVLEKYLSVLKDPPAVRLDEDVKPDEPVIVLSNGLTIRDVRYEEAGPFGPRPVQGFALERPTYRPATRWHPEEHDYQVLYTNACYSNVAAEAVRQTVSQEIDALLGEEAGAW
ncbi:MAG TPA: hypothetical protein VFA26_00645 [Gemmataceae bacterium]|nr:hypothetical protein [Gemmataceae bacterium]